MPDNQGYALRIAQVAPLWVRVPPKNYGGIERRVHYLTEELVRRGHIVTLFATADSETQAELRPTYKHGLTEAMDRGEAFSYDYYLNSNIAEALQVSDSFDVIHFHLGCVAIPLGLLSKAPVLHTIPTAITLDDQWVLNRYPTIPVTALSHQQLTPIDADRRQKIRVIHNGFDYDSYQLSEGPGEYLAFVGRIGPHKGPHEAIQIAKAAGLPIVISGAPLTREEKVYFQEVIRPLIDDKDVSYVGPVNDEQKNQLLSRALALLFPIQWDEPFGLVMIEAMACGVPVVACNRGSVSEVVDFAKTGFYGDSLNELCRFIDKAARLERKAVREHARQRFCYKRMVDEYLTIYESLATTTRADTVIS